MQEKSEYIFPDLANGDQRPDHDAQDAFLRVRKTAGLKDLHFHDLRRTFASRLAQRGVSLQAIAKLLGHGATYVTERYAHLSCDDLREAVNRLMRPAPSGEVGRNPAGWKLEAGSWKRRERTPEKASVGHGARSWN